MAARQCRIDALRSKFSAMMPMPTISRGLQLSMCILLRLEKEATRQCRIDASRMKFSAMGNDVDANNIAWVADQYSHLANVREEGLSPLAKEAD